MADRYMRRHSRSRTPEPLGTQNPAWMPTSPRMPRSRISRRSQGGWGSMGNLDQIMNTLQESIQQKQKQCYSSFESLDNLSDEDNDSGIRMTDSSCKWGTSNGFFESRPRQFLDSTNTDVVLLPHRKTGSRSLQGSRENLTEHDPDSRSHNRDFRTHRRLLPNPCSSSKDEAMGQTDVNVQQDSDKLHDRQTSIQDLCGSGDGCDGVKFGYKGHMISDNWLMKPARKSTEEAVSADVTSRFTEVSDRRRPTQREDINNNDDEAPSEESAHFVKNPKTTSRRSEVSSRRRSRWDCTSPVTIKRQDCKTQVLSRSEWQKPVTTSKPLVDYVRSHSADSGKAPKSPVTSTRTSTRCAPNPRFQMGFNLNAQRQLSGEKPTKSPLVENEVEKTSRSPKSKWRRGPEDASVLCDPDGDRDPSASVQGERQSGGSVMFVSSEDVLTENQLVEEGCHEAVGDKSYEAFFIPCSDGDAVIDAGQETGVSEMTEDERSVRFPQWVIPFIDDDLTKRFECTSHGRRPANVPPQSDGKSPGGAARQRSKSPRPGKSPVPPPRTKRTAAMNRILQEKDDLACRERPLPEKPERSRTPTVRMQERVKSPVRTAKRLPRLPSDSSSLSADGSEAESFPVHRVQHAKRPNVPVTKGVSLKTQTAQNSCTLKHSQSDKNLEERSRTNTRLNVSVSKSGSPRSTPNAGTPRSTPNAGTPRSTLTSKRSKSMDNLALLSSLGQNKSSVSQRGRQLGKTSSDEGASVSGARGQLAGGKNERATPAPTENRAMKALREAMAKKSHSTKSSVENEKTQRPTSGTARKQPLTPSSSVESKDGDRSGSRQSRSRKAGAEKTAVVGFGSKTSFGRQDSSDSDASGPRRPESRQTRARTPVRRSSSLKERVGVRISEKDDIIGETLALAGHRSQAASASASIHSGGYSTLRTDKSTANMPKRSILKKHLAPTMSKAGPDITTTSTTAAAADEEKKPTTRSGKHILPPPPDDVCIDLEGMIGVQSRLSVSVDNLNLSSLSSRDDHVTSPTRSRSRAPSTGSGDGSILGLRRAAFTSSRENLFKRSNSREGGVASGTATKATERSKATASEKSRALRKSSVGSSRESVGKEPDANNRTRAANGKAASAGLTQRGFSTSQPNLFRTSNAKRTTPSPAASRRPSNDGRGGDARRTTGGRRDAQSRTASDRPETTRRPVPSPEGAAVHRSPALARSGLQPVDSIKKHKKTLNVGAKSAARKMSDRFRKLVEGDIGELTSPAPSGGKAGGLSERENSFDSGVEFVMYL